MTNAVAHSSDPSQPRFCSSNKLCLSPNVIFKIKNHIHIFGSDRSTNVVIIEQIHEGFCLLISLCFSRVKLEERNRKAGSKGGGDGISSEEWVASVFVTASATPFENQSYHPSLTFTRFLIIGIYCDGGAHLRFHSEILNFVYFMFILVFAGDNGRSAIGDQWYSRSEALRDPETSTQTPSSQSGIVLFLWSLWAELLLMNTLSVNKTDFSLNTS